MIKRITGKKVALGAGGAAAAGAAGAFGGRVARSKDVEKMDEAVARDVEALRTTGRLAPVSDPVFALEPRAEKTILNRYLVGIVIGGFLVWLVTLIILLVSIEATGQEATLVEKVFPSLMFAGMAGLAGFVLPGILIGAFLWLREARARVRDATAENYRLFWGERERGAQALASGQANPTQVAAVLAQFHTAAAS